MTRSNLPIRLVLKLLILSLPISHLSWAQEQKSIGGDVAASYAGSTEANSKEYEFSQAELDQLLAPVALYPDTVLSHILVASTYPLEVIQAARWSKNNKKPAGNIALEKVDSKDWAPSVKALVQFPDLIQKMSEDLDWMQKLGDAFLQDEETVLATVQNLRQQARSEGSLDDIKHLQVSDDEGDIIIEPVTREVVYVPYYDSRVVYGSWWWPNFPPVHWHFPRIHHSLSLNHHFFWGTGIYVGSGIYFSSFHWRKRHVAVVDYRRHRNYRFRSGRNLVRHVDARRWRHNPRHRRGVSYRGATRVRHGAFSERRRDRRHASSTRERLRHTTISQRQQRHRSTNQERARRHTNLHPRQQRHRSTNPERTRRATNAPRQGNDKRNLRNNNQRREVNRAENNQRNRERRYREQRNREQRATRPTRAVNSSRQGREEGQRRQVNRRDERLQRNNRNQHTDRRAERRDKASANRRNVKLRNNSQRANRRNSNYRNNRSTSRRSDHRRSNHSSAQRSRRGGDHRSR